MRETLLFAISIGMGVLASSPYNDMQNGKQGDGPEVVLAVEEEMLFVEGKRYGIAPVGGFLQNGIGLVPQGIGRCGEYFYTIERSGRQFIGFKMPVPEAIAESGSIMRDFPRDQYRVLMIVPDTHNNPPPTVEFTGSDVIVRMTKYDFDRAPCFAYQRII